MVTVLSINLLGDGPAGRARPAAQLLAGPRIRAAIRRVNIHAEPAGDTRGCTAEPGRRTDLVEEADTWHLVPMIKAGLLIDGTGQPARRDMALDRRWEPDRGGSAVVAHRTGDGDGITVYNYPALTSMPGLIDAHDHLAHLGRDLKQRMNTPPSLFVLQTGRWATETLMAGVTSFRDAGGVDQGVKMAISQGVVPGPRLFISVAIITQTGGLDDKTQPCGLSSDFPRLPGMPDGIADGIDGCRRKVREMIRAGADWIKIATSGGVSSLHGGPATRQFSREELRVMVDEAHAAGKGVMVHAHGGDGLAMCLEAGVDSIEHGSLAEDAELELMAKRGMWLVPTLSVTQRMTDRLAADPQSLPPFLASKLPAVYERQRSTVKRALDLGVKVAMGTDAGGFGHAQNPKELVYMVQAGVTPMQTIVASTKMAAELLGMGDSLGTLEPGKLADLMLIDGNPLEDMSVVADPDRVELVMKAGVAYKAPTQPRRDAHRARVSIQRAARDAGRSMRSRGQTTGRRHCGILILKQGAMRMAGERLQRQDGGGKWGRVRSRPRNRRGVRARGRNGRSLPTSIKSGACSGKRNCGGPDTT